MINNQLINPKSIAVIGASNNVKKPGGKILKNLLKGSYKGDLYAVNLREKEVQGIKSFSKVEELPSVDLAILAVRAKDCPATVDHLAYHKNTKAFIIISAGFGELNDEGKIYEEKIIATVNKIGGCLIGPNCIGVMNTNYQGVFTTPIPKLYKKGCDLISGSGATAVFIMEAALPLGLRFSNIYSVGNAAQTSVEDVLEYMDQNFDPKKSATIKLLYLEDIKNPIKLLKHATSLIRKGCKIAAIKAGATAEGVRAAVSHTGAMANSDVATRSLFKKAGIVYCSSREELITVASVFTYKPLHGKNIGIITHAGGSAVMLTDALSKGGLKIPQVSGEDANELLTYLNQGSSVSNPFDFLATGTAEQLGILIDYCEHKFDEIDAMIVVFGSPGLFDVENVYRVLNVKMDICKKPIFPVLPSLINAQNEIQYFLSKGHVNFPDEVVLGTALSTVYQTKPPSEDEEVQHNLDTPKIRSIIDNATNGFLKPIEVNSLLKACGIDTVPEKIATTKIEAKNIFNDLGCPVVMKVIGAVHKSDVGGVALNLQNENEVEIEFDRMMDIEGTEAILIQPMLSGVELFAGGKYEKGFGHVLLCGLGGIYVEVYKDIAAGVTPLNKDEIKKLLESIKGYPIIKGLRGKKGINEELFIDIISRLSSLVQIAPEIEEFDINPLIGFEKSIQAVDARFKVKKKSKSYHENVKPRINNKEKKELTTF